MRKLPNVTVHHEGHRFSLRTLFWGEFCLRLVVGVRQIEAPIQVPPEWVVEVLCRRKGEDKEFRVVPPDREDDRYHSHETNPWWVLSDGGGREPRLCPYDTPRREVLPSPRWTEALWHRLAEHLAAEVGYDATEYDRADLEPEEQEPEDADVVLRAEPVAVRPPGEAV